jgi:hypothetical protein
MLQVGGDPYFLQESLGPKHRGELGVQNLDGDPAVVLFVVREINGRHPAAAELTLDGVGGERTLNLFDAISHWKPGVAA